MQELQQVEEKTQLARFYEDEYGFAAFYELLYGRELPNHAFGWIADIFTSQRAGRGRIIEAFRGSTKTTTVTIAFTTFSIGHNPWDSNMFIQASDESAEKKAQEVAGLIKDNPGFHAVFPWVKPDESVSWAARGYEVLSEMVKVPDGDGFRYEPIDYESWRRLKASITQDPTFIGLGLESGAIIGKHPTGILDLDDIHDEKNTRSARELEAVKAILESTILPITTTPTGGTRFKIVIGTPWKINDAFHALKAKPGFDHSFTPIMKDGRPSWPDAFNEERIENIRKDTPEIEFARMYLLDLTAAEGIHLKMEWLGEYPHEKIQDNWKVMMGVDYASSADQWETKGRERDYFALAIVKIIPGGGAVVVDGIREHMSQGEAELRVKSIAKMYPYLDQIGVEAVGKGEEFYHLLLRTSKLPIIPMFTKNKSKGERFEKQMAPLFQFGRAFVSSRQTPFLDHFKREWLQFPLGTHDDALDAVFWALDVGKHYLYTVPDEADLGVTNPMYHKERRPGIAALFSRR